MILFLIFYLIHDVFTITPTTDNLVRDLQEALSDVYIDNENENILMYLKEFDDTYYIDQYEANLYKNNHPRRIFGWINKIFKDNKTNNAVPKATESEKNIIEEKIRYHEIESNLTETLTKLEYILRQILDIVKYSRQDSFKTIQDFIPKNRQKRNANETIINTQVSNHTNVNTNITNKQVNYTNTQISGRRSFHDVNRMESNEVKDRLLHYIDEGFAEIKNKIDSLKHTKSMFSKDVNFRIGYIVANIDVLDANMNNLKDDMAKRMNEWNDWKIMNLYDTVKASSNAVSNLLEVLKTYIDKLN